MINVQQLCKKTAKELLCVYHNEKCDTKLVFPKERDTNNERISEQEARFAFANIVERECECTYSIETPTEKKYSFSNRSSSGQSAMTDLTLYVDNNQINVEFKHGNPEKQSIMKDMEKLIKEQKDGIFFMTLKNADKATIPVLLEKICEIFKDKDRLPKEEYENNNHELMIFICVYEKKLYGSKIIKISEIKDYEDLKSKLISTSNKDEITDFDDAIKKLNDKNWDIHE